MAYNKKTWKARQGLGLNKFSIDGATPVPIINQPDSVTQQGDALSAGNLNDLEQRIADAFDDVEESKADKSTTDALQSQINQHESRLENLEQKAGDYGVWHYPNDPDHSSDMPNAVPTGKAKYGLVKSFVGKSRAWNHLLNKSNYDSSTTVNNVTFTNNADGSISIQTTSSGASSNATFNLGTLSIINGHKYLVVLGKAVEGLVLRNNATATLNISNTVADIKTSDTSADNVTFSIRVYSGVVISTAIKVVPQLFDLTFIFGAGNEPSTVADALALLPALGQYNAYDAGSLVDTEVSGVKSGIKLVQGSIASNGADTTSTTRVRTDFIKVEPSSTHVVTLVNPKSNQNIFEIHYYNSAKGAISYIAVNSTSTTITVPSNCSFIKVLLRFTDNITTYPVDWENVLYVDNKSISAFFGTLSLPTPFIGRSAGTMADTDELNVEVNGVARRRQTTRIGSVDLGNLDWTYDSEYARFTATISPSMKLASVRTLDFVCGKYQTTKVASIADVPDKSVYNGNNSSEIFIHDSAYTDATTFKASLSGVYLNYELADESVTLLDPIIDNFIEVEGGGTVETIQEQSPVIDNSLDVGYLAV